MPDITVTEAGPTVAVSDSASPVVTVSALGTPGLRGPAGDTGPAGSTGGAGPAGPAGATWYQGASIPSAGLGANGDSYLRFNGDVYQKAAGSWGSPVASLLGPTGAAGSAGAKGDTGAQGPQGTAGSPGAAGADGKTLRYGSGVPSSGLGVDGDFYIDDTAHAVYGPKTTGAWGSGTSLIGPAGDAGATGADGPQGPEGPAGPGGGAALRGTWDVATAYAANDIVILADRAFQAVQAGTGHHPMPATQLFTGTPGSIDGGDPAAYEMGVKIQPTGDVRLNGVTFYKATANTGTHVGRLWQLGANGVYYKVNEAVFTGESASGWQAVALAADLSAASTYVVSVAFPAGHYSFDSGYFNAPVTSGSVTAPVGAGMYSTTVGHVPDHVGGNASYWITPAWGEANAAWWQEIGAWQVLAAFPSAQESAAAYVLSQIGANGGIAGLDGFGHLASTASGTATIGAGSTSTTAAHGLPRTPTLQQVSVTPTSTLGAAARFWASAVDGTNVTIAVDSAPGGSGATFVWQVGNL